MAYPDIKPYSDMVHQAKTFGGPEQYIAAIERNAIAKGREQKGKEDLCLFAVALPVGLGLWNLAKKAWTKYKLKVQERNVRQEKADKAKRQLIKELRDAEESAKIEHKGNAQTAEYLENS